MIPRHAARSTRAGKEEDGLCDADVRASGLVGADKGGIEGRLGVLEGRVVSLRDRRRGQANGHRDKGGEERELEEHLS